MTVTERIIEWTAVCRMPPKVPTDTRSPSQVFEQVVRDMAAAGFAMPTEVVAGVRSNLIAA